MSRIVPDQILGIIVDVNKLAPGSIFDAKYELLSVLGSGGVGTVYRARQIDIERIVALKILHEATASDPDFNARFLREAQSLNALSHPNIVAVYHLGISADGAPYLAMECVGGKSIRSLIDEQGKVPIDKAIMVLKQAAQALGFAHGLGIVHRDLKPENILWEEQDASSGRAKIIDFGLAHVEAAVAQRLTGTGNLIGTVFYMSPEQCRGQKIDARTDVYALAICFYEMLTGERPFVADNPVGTLYLHVNSPIPKLIAPEFDFVQPALNEFFQMGLAKLPEDRFQNMDELIEHLDVLSHGINVGTKDGKRGPGGTTANSRLKRSTSASKSRAIYLSPVLVVSFVLSTLVLLILAASIQFSLNSRKHAGSIEIGLPLGNSNQSSSPARAPRSPVDAIKGTPIVRLGHLADLSTKISEKYTDVDKIQRERREILVQLEKLYPILSKAQKSKNSKNINASDKAAIYALLMLKADILILLGPDNYQQAKLVLERNIEISKTDDGVETMQTAYCYKELASLLLLIPGEGNLDLAEKYAHKVVKIWQLNANSAGAVPSLEMPEVLDRWDGGQILEICSHLIFAEVANSKGDYERAVREFSIARKQADDQGYPMIVSSNASREAAILIGMGRMSAAKSVMRECHQQFIDKIAHRSNYHREMLLERMVYLGEWASANNMKDVAKEIFEQALTYEKSPEGEYNAKVFAQIRGLLAKL